MNYPVHLCLLSTFDQMNVVPLTEGLIFFNSSNSLNRQPWSIPPASRGEHLQTPFNLTPNSKWISLCSLQCLAASSSSSLWLKTSANKSGWSCSGSRRSAASASALQTLSSWWMCQITREAVVSVPPGCRCAALWHGALKCTRLWPKRLQRLLCVAAERWRRQLTRCQKGTLLPL